MIKVSIFGYYWFGTCLRFLQDTESGLPLRTEDDWGLLGNLASFFRYLEDLNLQVTQRASFKLAALRDELLSLDPETLLSKEHAQKIRDEIGALRQTLDAEIKGYESYIVTPKRMETNRLIEDMSTLFSPGVYNKLPEIAQYDLSEAGKCIAFERSTAAAFHILRATEAVLRSFYCALVLRGRVEMMWGNMIIDLRKKRKAKPHIVLLNNLDNIRVSFRNPTQHPESIYNIHEVQDLLGLCIDVINRMAAALP